MPGKFTEQKKRVFSHATWELGFDACRFVDPQLTGVWDDYKVWLDQKHHADMQYLEKHLPLKEDPKKVLDNVMTAIVLIKNYKNTKQSYQKNSLKIARYAVGLDYHIVMRQKLEQLAKFIEQEFPQAKCYWGVDSSPIAERSLALRSGIGFRGKNSMVIRPGMGSYFFIGVILTSYPFLPDKPLMIADCGQCRICIDSCPTKAIQENSTIDAAKCISYQTIERKSPLNQEEIKNCRGWLFGCDICQEVCPYNKESVPYTSWNEFMPSAGVGFDFFDDNTPDNAQIPKETVLYRSRDRLLENWKSAIALKNNEKRNDTP